MAQKRTRDLLKEMIEVFGKENIPNPEHYPLRFEFLTKTVEHMRTMRKGKEVETTT
ncbi:MAG: hypothetical protein WCY93_08650 [Anaerolineaceae bacterium]